MRPMVVVLLALGAAMAVAGCVSGPAQNDGLVVRLQADPVAVFENGNTLVHMDLLNTDTKRLVNVRAEIFETGALDAGEACGRQYDRLLPGQFETFPCPLTARTLIEPHQTNTVYARALFDAEFAAVQPITALTEGEYQNQIAAGTFVQKPSEYRYADRNIAVRLSFSEPLPLIVRPEKDMFMRITILNIGNGFVQPLDAGDIVITQRSGDGAPVLDTSCIPERLLPLGKEFPTMSCRINPFFSSYPDNTAKPIESYDITLTINYAYEVRESVQVRVLK